MVSDSKTDWFVDDFSEDEGGWEESESETEESFQSSEDSSCHSAANSEIDSDTDSLSVSQAVSHSSHSRVNEALDLTQLAPPGDHTRVLYIAELVQEIFANFPFRDRVIFTGVCKTWRQLLRDDTASMFLKPLETAPFTAAVFPTGCGLSRMEKIQNEWHQSLNTQESCQKKRCITLRPHRSVDHKFVNPLFLNMALNKDTCLRINGHSASFVFVDASSISSFLDLHRNSARDAGWRSMLTTNPPIKRFWAYSDLEGDVVENDNGVKLGEVATYVAEIVRREVSRDEGWTDKSRLHMVERMLLGERITSERH